MQPVLGGSTRIIICSAGKFTRVLSCGLPSCIVLWTRARTLSSRAEGKRCIMIRSKPVVLLVTAWSIVATLANESRAAWQIEPVDLSGQVGWSLFLDSDPAGTVQAAFYTNSPNG